MKRVLAQDRKSGELGVAGGHVPAVARQRPEPVVGDVSNFKTPQVSRWDIVLTPAGITAAPDPDRSAEPD
jgi:hypothetical protein